MMFLLSGLCATLPVSAADIVGDRHPNVLILQTDDMGFDDLQINGQQVFNTPYLDRLGNESVRFQNFYVQSVSAATRSCLMTGRHFWKTGVTGMHGGRDFMNLDEKTIAQYFQQSGYVTGMWGKWHCGKTEGYYPWQRGFDEAYMALLYDHAKPEGLMNGAEVKFEGKWSDAVCAELAINFMKKHAHKGVPFFAYVSFLSPHGLWDAPDEYIKKYIRKGYSDTFSTLAGQVEHLDFQIGRILDFIDKSGLAENTIVLFMSDNGPIPDVGRMKVTAEEWTLRNPNKARGNKATNWRNGLHVPLFLRYGNKYEAGDNWYNSNICDILPTLAELCGVSIVNAPHELDGKSFASFIDLEKGNNREASARRGNMYFTQWSPVLRGYNGGIYEEDIRAKTFVPLNEITRSDIYFEDQQICVINGNYKMLMNMPGEEPVFLTSISDDPHETVNIAEKYPEIADKLYADARVWFREVYDRENSFNMPVFFIGKQEKLVNDVLGYSPIRISEGLRDAQHYLTNWNKKGQWAEYELIVETPGVYEVCIRRNDGTPVHDTRFEVSVLSSEKRKVMSASMFSSSEHCRLTLHNGMAILRLELKSDHQKKFEISEITLVRSEMR